MGDYLMGEIFRFVPKDEYERECTSLKDGEFKTIYNSSEATIDLLKSGKRIYKFIAYYGNKSFEECIKNISKIQA